MKKTASFLTCRATFFAFVVLLISCSDDSGSADASSALDGRADAAAVDGPGPDSAVQGQLRVAQYNIEFLSTIKLKAKDNQVAAAVKVITRHSPDIIAINEMQHDLTGVTSPKPGGLTVGSNNARLMADLLNAANPKARPYKYTVLAMGNFGFTWPGFDSNQHDPYFQYLSAFGQVQGSINTALISRYPIDTKRVQVITDLEWSKLPGNKLSELKAKAGYTVPAGFPLFGNSLVVVPVDVDGTEVQFVLLHTTPPKGKEINNYRNYDELRGLRLLVEGKLPGASLGGASRFVLMGDFNADPDHGDALPGAAAQLLGLPSIALFTPTGAGTYGVNPERNTFSTVCVAAGGPDPATGKGWQIDYLLPSKTIGAPTKGGMFYPDRATSPADWTLACQASDHMLLWADLLL
jgi:endonuclease/exonuclease/phosphatase family metal-dependent hydrolase